MRVKHFMSVLMLTAVLASFAIGNAEAANVSVNINGYLPAPPGVAIRVDAGRPYYVERDRRVYMERRPSKHYRKHHKKRHYKDERHYDRGHDRHEGRGGHGR